MRSKKGFTLIELLAVIVILAIIALIAVPIILNMINDARKGAAVDSAYGYVEAIEYQNSMNSLNTEKYEKITDGENIDVTTIDSLVKVKGTRPDSGTITIEKGRVKDADLCIDGFNIIYDGKKASATDSTKCGSGSESDEVEEVVIKDEVSCQLASETIDDKEYLYIDSVEDMYAFSKSVNGGNTYEGKIVKLRNNLNFEDYKPEKKDSVCEINNDSGFIPIGTEAHPFMGTFDGGAKTISNLIINKPNQDNVGLFGYVKGTNDTTGLAKIYGLTVENIEISGKYYVGGLIGKSMYASIVEVVLDGIAVNGKSGIGGLIGRRDYGKINNIILKSGTVTSTSGSVGSFEANSSGTSGVSSIIVENILVKGPVGVTYVFSGNNNSIKTYSNDVKVNGSNVSDGFDPKGINDLNFYESVGLDTWIGGDDNTTGYYFDYDKSGDIVLKSIKNNPFPNETKILATGNGTKENPYLIKNEQDWKKITAYSDKENLFIKLDNNLDFSTKKYYMLGSNQNKFSGTLDGNDKTIKNVTINGSRGNYLGMFGYVKQGTLHSFRLNNIEINGFDYTGIFGFVEGTDNTTGLAKIYSIIVDKVKVTGNSYVGGLVGKPKYASIIEISLDDININGKNGPVGGLMGTREKGIMNNILIKNGTLNSDVFHVGSLEGYENDLSYGLSNIIVENTSVTGGAGVTFPMAYNIGALRTYSNSVKVNGTNVTDGFDPKYVGDLDYYAGKLETLYDGDKNGTGYFFDYVDAKTGIKLVKAYTPVETDTPTEKANCTVSVSKDKERGCYLYTSGVHGNYLYEGVPVSDTGTGATCTGTGRSPAYRYKITYNCS